MSNGIELEYGDLPAVIPSYVRAATMLSDDLAEGATIPSITGRVNAVTADPQRLARYRDVCSFPRMDHFPVTYPHVLAFGLQMAVMTHKQFPLKLLGLVHVRNEITQHRAIGNEEVLDLSVRVGGHREVRRGLEFDLVTQLSDDAGHIIWEETGTMLSRRSGGRKRSGEKQAAEEPSFEAGHHAHWDISADVGRRYAAAAGDFNPIHLSRYSARLFGFRRAIATGMWLKARVAAELTPYLSTSAYRLRVVFERPVFLPSPVSFGYNLSDTEAVFALTSPEADVVHLQGVVSYL